MIGLVALHALFGSIGLACGDRYGRRCLLLGAIAPAATFVWLLFHLGGVFDDIPVTQSVEWVPALGVRPRPAARRLRRADGRCWWPASACSSTWYAAVVLPGRARSISDVSSALLTLFAGSMLGLVLADNLIVLYGFWELTSITSFLLIGNSAHRRPGACGGAPGAAHHERRGAGHAGRLRRHRPGRRHVPDQRDRRRPADRHHGRRRVRPGPGRRVHEVGPVPTFPAGFLARWWRRRRSARSCTRRRWSTQACS